MIKKFLPYVIGFLIGSLLCGSATFWYFNKRVIDFYTATAWLGEYIDQGDNSVTLSKNMNGNGDPYSAYVLVTTARGCIGEFKGTGGLNGNTMVFSDPKSNCVLNMILNMETKVISVVSSSSCSELHGLNCSFDNAYRKTCKWKK